MSENETFLVVDAGNTRIKYALFQNDEQLSFFADDSADLKKSKSYLSRIKYSKSIISSVRNKNETDKIKSLLINCFDSAELHLPIEIIYETPQSLGADRIANAVAAKFVAKKSALIIDIGTCLKFDYLNKNGQFEGGSISPGIHLRYKSLNDYTGNLPLLNETEQIDFLGTSTKSCIQSGVLNGIQGEINFFMEHYTMKNKDLTIFVTGGDYLNFDYSSKNNIFAVGNLTLLGLYYILKSNAN
jgi:type III pantothenate kinase